jgi:hypothetical protein
MGEIGTSDNVKESAWFLYDDEDCDTLVQITFMGLQKMRVYIREAQSSRLVRLKKITADELAGMKIAEIAVMGWKHKSTPNHTGFTKKGEQYPCTPENLKKMILDDKDFVGFVSEIATERKYFDKGLETVDVLGGKPSSLWAELEESMGVEDGDPDSEVEEEPSIPKG